MKHLLPTPVGGTQWVGHIELAIQTFLRGYQAIVPTNKDQVSVTMDRQMDKQAENKRGDLIRKMLFTGVYY